ncbi:MAG TPA: HAMP domain-containing methyl-accepting chemotaxis protein [Thermoanaerobaculia bacterium]|nr:HAMP domain-containing methyl-accepting chemotaxis protein [Thermoanaerobaculia bacterium]
MRFSHRYIGLVLLPPIAILLPLATAFLVHVTRVTHWLPIAFTGAAVYLAGALLFFLAVEPCARRAEEQRTSEAISECLARTVFGALLLWLGAGALLALTGWAVIRPTFLGLQYFAEAVLIVAAPAMAWSYWTGKRLLIGSAVDVRQLAYRGRVYSIGWKIAMVFIGFYIVSVGALVHMVSSRISDVEIAGEVAGYGLLIAGLTAVIFAVATYFLARDITAPMQRLMRLASAMAAGQFDVEPRVFADDEIGTLAASFAVTREHLRELIGNVGSRGGAITSGVRVMREGTDALLTGAREQSTMTEQSVASVFHVRTEAESVLTAADTMTEAASDSAARSAELRASSQEVAARMEDLARSVEKSASGTDEISASANEMSRRTTVLSGLSNDVLSFVAEMDATIRNIHETATTTETLASEASGHARTGREAVDETVSGIRTVQEATRRTIGAFESLQTSLGQIGQILTFIDEVTNRTNLLSFNAAIIAAQAGQNDFGFSVIADEIRQLADRTRQSTKEISGIIRNVQPVAQQALAALGESGDRVDRTVALAQNAAGALATILESAERSMTMSRTMARSLEEQARATKHLHEVTARMSEHVDEIDRATRGQAEATRLLSQEAERVSDIAAEVKRATDDQVATGAGIAQAMEQIASDVRVIRDRLGRQLAEAEAIASATRATLTIAKKNNAIAEQFSAAIEDLVVSGKVFSEDVGRFRI